MESVDLKLEKTVIGVLGEMIKITDDALSELHLAECYIYDRDLNSYRGFWDVAIKMLMHDEGCWPNLFFGVVEGLRCLIKGMGLWYDIPSEYVFTMITEYSRILTVHRNELEDCEPISQKVA